MTPKDLQHCHALVAIAFPDVESRGKLIERLAGRANIDASSIENFTHDGKPAAVIHMRYRARGANMHDMRSRLAAAARAAGVEYEVIQEPRGFSVKRPELEQDVPRRATTDPTEPVQADWTQVGAVSGPDAPFQGALRVPLLGPVDDDWLAALDDVAAGTDVLDAIVEDAALYVPDAWRGKPALTQAGEPRQALREAVTQFLNLVNDQYHFRVAGPGRATEDTFEALTAVTLAWPRRPHYEGRGGVVIWPYERDGRRGFTSAAVVSPGWAPWPERELVPPATEQERDGQIEWMLDQAAGRVRSARREGAKRAALLFPSWVGEEPWLVAHVFERGRTATYQAPQADDLDWREVESRDRFGALVAALTEEDPP